MLTMYLSVYLPTYLCTYPSIHLPTQPPIHSPTHPPPFLPYIHHARERNQDVTRRHCFRRHCFRFVQLKFSHRCLFFQFLDLVYCNMTLKSISIFESFRGEKWISLKFLFLPTHLVSLSLKEGKLDLLIYLGSKTI